MVRRVHRVLGGAQYLRNATRCRFKVSGDLQNSKRHSIEPRRAHHAFVHRGKTPLSYFWMLVKWGTPVWKAPADVDMSLHLQRPLKPNEPAGYHEQELGNRKCSLSSLHWVTKAQYWTASAVTSENFLVRTICCRAMYSAL